MREINNDWESLHFFTSSHFGDVVTFLKEEKQQGKLVLPEFANVLNALALTPLEHVKVVILGQDPYPTPGHANGLAFSVSADVRPLPKSLKNIFKELHDDIGCPIPKSGDLTKWAERGVLLLNTTLTVESGRPASHAGKGWEVLTTEIIQTVNDFRENVVFILWGKSAAVKARLIDEPKHLVITAPHPSPLSAHTGFFRSKPFSKTDAFLTSRGIEPIDWSL